MKDTKTAFVTFFPIIPNNMGSSTVVNERFNSWPKKKKLFQISHLKKTNNNKIKTIFINKEKPIFKIASLPKMVYEIYLYLKNSKKKILIIEGASWIFYSFIVFVFLKFIFKDLITIYMSHSIESEIRKKYSNKIIFNITYYFENYIFNKVNFATTVSNEERKKIKRLYKINTILFPNSVEIKKKIGKRAINCKYILYSGSYYYKPNKDAIDELNNNIFPKLIKKYPNLKLVLTGGGYKKKYPWLINKNIVTKNKLYNFIRYALCMCVPLKFGSGTRIKILETLCVGGIVVSSKKGIEGINLKKKNPPFIYKKNNHLIKKINFVLKNEKLVRKIALSERNYYRNKYSMKIKTKEFIEKLF